MDYNSFINREKTIKDKATMQEKRIAKRNKLRTTIASGAKHFDKADIKGKHIRIECKRTDKRQIIIKKEWLEKLERETTVSDIPVMNIEIQNENWYLVRQSEFDYILELIKEETCTIN
jgi:hypothetical protein